MENNNRNFIIGLVVLAIVIIALIGLGFNRDKIKPDTNEPTIASTQNKAEEAKYFSEDASVMFFFSEGCGWCQKQKTEVLSKLGEEGYRVKPVDVAKDRDAFIQYQVNSTPTFVAKNGDKLVGFQEYDTLKKWLDAHK